MSGDGTEGLPSIRLLAMAPESVFFARVLFLFPVSGAFPGFLASAPVSLDRPGEDPSLRRFSVASLFPEALSRAGLLMPSSSVLWRESELSVDLAEVLFRELVDALPVDFFWGIAGLLGQMAPAGFVESEELAENRGWGRLTVPRSGVRHIGGTRILFSGVGVFLETSNQSNDSHIRLKASGSERTSCDNGKPDG